MNQPATLLPVACTSCGWQGNIVAATVPAGAICPGCSRPTIVSGTDHAATYDIQQATPQQPKPKGAPRGAGFGPGFHPDRWRPSYRVLSQAEQQIAGQGHCSSTSPNGAGVWQAKAGKFSDYLECSGCGLIFDPSTGQAKPARVPAAQQQQAQGLQKIVQQLKPVIQELQTKYPQAKAPAEPAPSPKQQPKQELPQYPMAQAEQLGDAVDAAKGEGKIESGFGLRRQVLLIRCWKALVGAGMEPANAFRLAFALTAAERATEDERDFYKELWHAKMACNLYPLPTLPLPRDGQIWHQVAGVAIALVRAGIPIWAHGDAGAGKTVMFRMIAQHLGLPYHRFQGTRQRTVDDMVGGWGFDGQKTVKRFGVVPEAMQAGAMLAIDEGSALAPDVTFEFHAVLEGQPLTILKFGDVIQPAPGFCITVSDNSVGKGERSEYVGTLPANEAFRDRFVYMRVTALPEKVRRAIMQQELNA